MLVKELRQGLRTRSFIGVFLTLQIVLGVILLAAGTTGSSDEVGSSISNTIFIFFSIAVILIQPMRGMGALSSEIKGNTIDMMVLTRLSAWRIVTGKWSAIVSQSALMLITIIPYLILRYFFGGMNLLGEMVLLGLIFITSATLTAITVGLSASTSVILRSILPMLALPIGSYILLMMIMFSRGGDSLVELCALDTNESRVSVTLYVAACIYIGYFLLAAGTSLIAPLSENQSTLRRLIALGVTILAVILAITYINEDYLLLLLFALVLTPPFIVNLTEFGSLAPPVHERFSRYGTLGKLAGVFLFPGWASGVFFSALLALIASIAFFLYPESPYTSDHFITVAVIGLATLLFPALLLKVFKMEGPVKFSNYLLVLVTSGVLSLVLFGIGETTSNPEFLWLFVWIPPVMFSMLDSSIGDAAVMGASLLISAAYFSVLLILAIRQYRESIHSIHQSYTSLEPES
jgi:ABC-type transport system involved in multi-copper enzyme maturation permease subunit